MLILFIFIALGFTGVLWLLDVALDNYKELGRAKYKARLELYQQGIVSDWRVIKKDHALAVYKKDITC